MATVVLSTAGAALGSAVGGPFGLVVGRALGAIAGAAIDNALFGEVERTEGPRLEDIDVQASTDGTPIPRVYGWNRVTGQVIWATRFEEEAIVTQTSGGKGGPTATSTEYQYYGNFAVGLCEGPIHAIQRVWADGKPVDVSGLPVRFYMGDEEQDADPLIVAKEGSDNAPAYRGLSYAVLERLPLADYGNRLPQLSFEVIRALPGVEQQIKAVTLIPGATEFGYDPRRLTQTNIYGATRTENRHATFGHTDWDASINALTSLCPNLESVALVVSWFGTDLRAAQCLIRPAVENGVKSIYQDNWAAAGLSRASAPLVSKVDGRPAFGGTPSDKTVVAAIQDLKARGLKVTIIPFVMMDIPAANTNPDPWTGNSSQPAYPWRGRITCDPAPGQPGSPDKTAAAATQIDAFAGAATAAHFSTASGAPVYGGPPEWSFRRFVLHYAHLCALAGGVDAFLLGSEFVGATKVRSGSQSYPFVQHLVSLAAEVRTVLGPATALTYGADWTEYFGHQPQDGSGDVNFHLDPLWSATAITAVGIDNYMPLADWRDGTGHLDAAGATSTYDLGYLRANIANGEGYDWYYASAADRDAQIRTPITDGAYDKPWVFRYKDLVAWWQSPHINRVAGVEQPNATAWVPESKPIWFTELGCPAVDKGANQPNVFPDPKSSESAFPYFSSTQTDDEIQRRFLEAHMTYWDETAPDFDPAKNPVSGVYGGRMVSPSNIYMWTWDARPFPYFPRLTETWSDGDNWQTGHWLSGRMGMASFSGLVAAIAQDFDIPGVDATALTGQVRGYMIDRPMSARSAIEPLMDLGAFDARQTADMLVFSPRDVTIRQVFTPSGLAAIDDNPLVSAQRAQETELPTQLTIAHFDEAIDYQAATASSRRLIGQSRRESRLDVPIVTDLPQAQRMAETRLLTHWQARERVKTALPQSALALEPGDVVLLEIEGNPRRVEIVSIEDGTARSCEGRIVLDNPVVTPLVQSRPVPPTTVDVFGAPFAAFIDLPILPGEDNTHGTRIAVFSDPWPGSMSVWRSASDAGFKVTQLVPNRATFGILDDALQAGPIGRFDLVSEVKISQVPGTLVSVDDTTLFSGANAMALRSDDGGWEVIQFAEATLIAANTYRLTRLLRGQLGTEDAMKAGHAAGSTCILLNDAVGLLTLNTDQIGLDLNYQIGPPGAGPGDDAMLTTTHTANGRGLQPLAPVHLRAKRDTASGDVNLTWIRRTRRDGDSWLAADVPLHEESEAYIVDVLVGGNAIRTVTVNISAWTYLAVDQMADFGSLPLAITFRVRQVSSTVGPGIAVAQSIAL